MERSALEVGSWLTTIGLRSSITIQTKEAVLMRTSTMTMMYMFTYMYDRTSYGIGSAHK